MTFKKYEFRFDIWGFLLFFLIMMPNFIWFAVPAPNDVLRAASRTQALDAVASFCQVFMVLALGILQNRARRKLSLSPFVIAVIACCLLYFISWIVYYMGIVNAAVILGLTLPPCLAFAFWAMERKNQIAMIPISIFTICHLIYAVINFIV